jgi:hypothetical protein
MPLLVGAPPPGNRLSGVLLPPDASPALLGGPVALEEVVNDAGCGPVAEFSVDQVLDCGWSDAGVVSQLTDRRLIVADY